MPIFRHAILQSFETKPVEVLPDIRFSRPHLDNIQRAHPLWYIYGTLLAVILALLIIPTIGLTQFIENFPKNRGGVGCSAAHTTPIFRTFLSQVRNS